MLWKPYIYYTILLKIHTSKNYGKCLIIYLNYSPFVWMIYPNNWKHLGVPWPLEDRREVMNSKQRRIRQVDTTGPQGKWEGSLVLLSTKQKQCRVYRWVKDVVG